MIKVSLAILLVFLFVGCSAKNILTPQSKKVRIYNRLPVNMYCEYKDEIIGSEANMLTFLFMSNREMTAGARADLRNQAVKLGGNSVEVQSTDFVYTSSTVFIGQVYNCRPKE